MNKNKDIIVNSLKYYDYNNEKYSKIIDKAFYYSIIRSNNDIVHDTIVFYDKYKNIIFKSRFEIFGFYSAVTQLWAWSWSIIKYPKNLIFLARKILNYGLDLGPDEDPFLKAELITSRFRITNDIQLDIHAAIASYISKKPFIFKVIIEPENIRENPEEIYEIIKDKTNTSIIQFLFILDDNI